MVLVNCILHNLEKDSSVPIYYLLFIDMRECIPWVRERDREADTSNKPSDFHGTKYYLSVNHVKGGFDHCYL